jgi:hypothetical protein
MSIPARTQEIGRHTADWGEETRALSCSCGDATGYVAHVAALLGVDEADAREALLELHSNVETNAGMCGACEACAGSSAAVHCPVCGDADEPCLTYFVAAGRGPTPPPQTLKD